MERLVDLIKSNISNICAIVVSISLSILAERKSKEKFEKRQRKKKEFFTYVVSDKIWGEEIKVMKKDKSIEDLWLLLFNKATERSIATKLSIEQSSNSEYVLSFARKLENIREEVEANKSIISNNKVRTYFLNLIDRISFLNNGIIYDHYLNQCLYRHKYLSGEPIYECHDQKPNRFSSFLNYNIATSKEIFEKYSFEDTENFRTHSNARRPVNYNNFSKKNTLFNIQEIAKLCLLEKELNEGKLRISKDTTDSKLRATFLTLRSCHKYILAGHNKENKKCSDVLINGAIICASLAVKGGIELYMNRKRWISI